MKTHAKRPKKPLQITPLAPLDAKEREELAKVLNSPLMQRALCLVEQFSPSAFKRCDESKNADMSMLTANNAYHSAQGWKLHEIALFRLTLDPVIRAKTPEETYPEQ